MREVRPKKIEGSRKFMMTLDANTEKDMDLLKGYMTDIVGVPLSRAGIIRVALKRYLEQMEKQFIGQVKKNDEDKLKAFLASQKKYAIDVNQINPDRIQ